VFGWAAFDSLTTKRSILFMKTKLFNEILSKVSEVTEIDKEEILKSNKEECTDARYILIQLLFKMGFTDTEVSERMGCSRQSVNYAKNHFEERLGKWSVRTNYQELSLPLHYK
jgi:hypothetical protein